MKFAGSGGQTMSTWMFNPLVEPLMNSPEYNQSLRFQRRENKSFVGEYFLPQHQYLEKEEKIMQKWVTFFARIKI